MGNMRFKVGDRVRIKSIDWYNENKDEDSDVPCREYDFVSEMSVFCGKILTIDVDFEDGTYLMKEDTAGFVFEDEMIEGLVEEEKKPNIIEEAKTYWDSIKDAWICPEGYIFKDENGNIINATKIVLEKKEKEYPKTYEECCKVMNYCCNPVATKTTHKENLIRKFQFLLLYRDAYWKIAGDWKPDFGENFIYAIGTCYGTIEKRMVTGGSGVLLFPTEEMRDAFYENFKELINECKELL